MVEVIDLSNAGLSKLPHEEAVSLIMRSLGYDRVDAEFYLAVASGKIRGDCLEPKDMTESEKMYFDVK